MNKITHYKRYENNKKKKYQPQNYSLKYSSYQENHYTVIETTYQNAFVIINNQIKKLSLSKSIKGVCNKIIFPGDKVIIEKDQIIGLLPRKNILSRYKKDSTSYKEKLNNQIVATNIDLAIIVVSAGYPALHPKLIDRYMIILKNQNIPFIICINKIDLLTSKEKSIIEIYNKLNIPLIKTSTYTKEGIDTLLSYIKGKQSILIGHSGVGKSSLINTLLSSNYIKTGELSNKKGCHTTTKSKYYEITPNTSIIDTPGIRSLDLSSYQKEDIKNYFPEFIPYNNLCKYHNCLHYQEPFSSCKIKQLVKAKIISIERYESYLKIIKELS